MIFRDPSQKNLEALHCIMSADMVLKVQNAAVLHQYMRQIGLTR